MAHIRTLVKDDIQPLLELYHHYVDDQNYYRLPENIINEITDKIFAYKHVNYFVVEQDKKIIGSCILTITPSFIRGGQAFGVIEHVVIHKDFRRSGYGERLMQHAMNFAWQNACSEILLMSISNNHIAHKLYKKLGFDPDKKTGFIIYRN